MPVVSFTSNLNRHLECPELTVAGENVSEALEAIFETNPRLRSYIVDEHGRLRQHVAVFVGGEAVRDRERLSDSIEEHDEIFVMQALSGG
jgi:molybdopterin synthase sulfur carrier subunit